MNEPIKKRLFFLGDYIPKNRNIEDAYSNKIIKFKDGDKNHIDYFANIIIKRCSFLNQYQFTFCRVPSSDKDKIVNSCNRMIDKLIHLSSQSHINGSLCLRRHTSISPQHKNYGLKLAMSEHEKTIRVDYNLEKLVNDRNIVLFDDVITSRNSMEACTSILFKHKAKKIIQIVLGKTKAKNE